METISEILILFLRQFAGGPGPIENNLVRFGLPAIMWGILLSIAWTRQRTQNRPREKLLVWGFGLAFLRELFMFIQVVRQIADKDSFEATCTILKPFEHALGIMAMIVVAGAFLGFFLNNEIIARYYMQIGLGITLLVFGYASITWPLQISFNPQKHFHQTLAAWFFHISTVLMLITAIILLIRSKDHLKTVVASALTFFLFSELLVLLNFATNNAYTTIVCPVSNSFHILATPLLGYVYFREQAIEKKQAEDSLIEYRNHLEELISERTAALTELNLNLKNEVSVRAQAEKALSRLSNRYESILESAGEGICGINPNGNFVFANATAATMLGYTHAELINQYSHNIWHPPRRLMHQHSPDDCPIADGYIRGVQRKGDDEVFYRKDGSCFPVRYFSNPTWENDKLSGTVVIFQDITARKLHEETLAQRNASLATQNAVSAALSQSLDIKRNLAKVLTIVQQETGLNIGLIFLLESEENKLNLYLHNGLQSKDDIPEFITEDCTCMQNSYEALDRALRNEINQAATSTSDQSTYLASEDELFLISIPIASKGNTVGILTLASHEITEIQHHRQEMLTAICQQIGMAIENTRLYQDSEKRREEMTRLSESSLQINKSMKDKEITFELARQTAWLLNCQKVCILRAHHRKGQIKLSAHHGMTKDDIETVKKELPDWAFIQELISEPKTIVIHNALSDNRLPESLLIKFDIRRALLIPIWSAKTPNTFIFLIDTDASHRWHAREVELIEGLANRGAVALVNADLHQQLELSSALEERQRIAANMHDGLAQTLSLLGLRVDRIQELVENGNNYKNTLDAIVDIRRIVANAVTEVRGSIASLQRIPQPPKSLQDQLEELLKQFNKKNRPVLSFSSAINNPIYLHPNQSDQVMPVIQEAILNAITHSQARNICVRLQQSDKVCSVAVEDDGIGFDHNRPQTEENHFGLNIMQARAARINGELQIQSSLGNGAKIILIWRCDEDDAETTNLQNFTKRQRSL